MGSFLLFILSAILLIATAYSSFVVDKWGSITLPYRTNFCQNTLPTDTYTKYKCKQDESDHPIIQKTVYKDSLCTNIYDIDSYSSVLHMDSDPITINDIQYNCTNDLNNAFLPLYKERHFIEVEANCNLDPPGERRVYLQQNQCFLLSNKTGTNTTLRVLYGYIGCEYDPDTALVTRLHLNDATCSSEPIVERIIYHGECYPWLYPNETEFKWTVYAAVWHCYGSKGYRYGMNVVVMLFVYLMLYDCV